MCEMCSNQEKNGDLRNSGLKSILHSTPWSAEADRQGVLGDKESKESECRLQPKAKANQWWDQSLSDP